MTVRWAQVAPPMYIERAAAAAAVRHNIEMAPSRTASAALASRHLFEGGGGGIGVKAAPPERCMPSLSALFSPVVSAGIVPACLCNEGGLKHSKCTGRMTPPKHGIKFGAVQ